MTIRKMAACMMALVLMMMSTAALAQHGDITTPRQGIAVAAPNNPKEGGSWLVLPAEGEMTYEQARARAIDLALENPQALVHVKEERRNREEIETFWADIRLVWNESRGSARWEIYFQAPDDYEQAFHVNMEADGTLVSVEVSNG